MNNYMKLRYQKRRQNAIEYLGGKCVDCNSLQHLEFDHIDRSTKLMTVAKASSLSEERFWNEVNKCVLRCTECHLVRTKAQGALNDVLRHTVCMCGKEFHTKNAYAGHKTWCKEFQ